MTPAQGDRIHEREDTLEIEHRLEASRLVPRAAFRGELRRHLLSGSSVRAMPGRVRLIIAAYAGSGAALLAIAGIGVAGIGPFAA